jgi:alpha-tubulin suppressor-like RCC1 family protein
MSDIQLNIGGNWKVLSTASCNIGGEWKEVIEILCNINGVWKSVWTNVTDSTLLFAWGEGTYGAVGDGTTTAQFLTPTAVGSDSWGVIAHGLYHALGINNNGVLYTWGRNQYGQLGNGTTVNELVPSTPLGTGNCTWKAIAGGERHTLAIRGDNTLWGWGENTDGQNKMVGTKKA